MRLGSLISINFFYGGAGPPGVEVRLGPSGGAGGGEAAHEGAEGRKALPRGGPEAREDQGRPRSSRSQSVYRDPMGRPLTRREVAELLELKARDQQVRRHEAAHMAAGGPYIRGGPTYSYRVGPDGKRYAVGGEVSIDTSPEQDPRQTIAKMRVVERAALAPADPSGQDRMVAAKAAMEIVKAEMELLTADQRQREGAAALRAGGGQGGPQANGSGRPKAVDIYV